MDVVRLREQLAIDEGYKEEIYLDHLGYPTFGIGHLITHRDPEYGKPVGTKVTEQRVHEAFEDDFEIVLEDCEKLFSDFEQLPEDVQQIVANMMFNIGLTRMLKFKKFRAAIAARDWSTAADEMIDSAWYNQVPNRAKRLVDEMRAV